MNIIETCLQVSISAHKGQVDKLGYPYIMHPLFVAGEVRELGLNMYCIALLHDVLEDSDYSLDDLKLMKIPDNIINSVVILTKNSGESYFNYIDRITKSGDRDAMQVKAADLTHNLSKERRAGISESQVIKYKTALQRINSILSK